MMAIGPITTITGGNMKVTDLERAIFRMSPAEFNAYLANVKEEVASEADTEDAN